MDLREENEEIKSLYRKYVDTDRFDKLIHEIDLEHQTKNSIQQFKQLLKTKAKELIFTRNYEELEDIIHANYALNNDLEDINSKISINYYREDTFYQGVQYINAYIEDGEEILDDELKKEQGVNFYGFLHRVINEVKLSSKDLTFSPSKVYKERYEQLKWKIVNTCRQIRNDKKLPKNQIKLYQTIFALENYHKDFEFTRRKLNEEYYKEGKKPHEDELVYEYVKDTIKPISMDRIEQHKKLEALKVNFYLNNYVN